MIRLLCVAALAALLARPAFGQPVSPPPVPSPSTPGTPGAKGVDPQQVPGPQKLTLSSQTLITLKTVFRDILGKLQRARREKDVVKLNCLNEKLTEVKGLLRISEQSDASLQEAVARKDESMSDHEFLKMSIARQKAEELRSQAAQCIGQLAFRTDGSLSVQVQVPADLPGGDPTDPQLPPPITISPPPASPTQ